jgi:hypothetical protein
VKLGDLVKYSESEYSGRFGTQGIIVDVEDEKVIPPVVTIMWENGEFVRMFSDELTVINC